MSDWFTTKKRGRDDDEIARDRDTALVARGKKPTRKAKTAAGKRSNSKKKSYFSEDEESIDEFIVDDDHESIDDEIEYDESSVSTTAEESSSSTSAPSHKGKPKKQRQVTSRPSQIPKLKSSQKAKYLVDSSDDEDKEESVFSGKVPTRKPQASVLEVAVVNKKSKNATKASTKENVSRYFQSNLPDSSSSDDDDESPLIVRKRHSFKKRNVLENESPSSNRKRKPRDSDDEDEQMALALALSKSLVEHEVSSSLQDTPDVFKSKKKIGNGKKQGKPKKEKESDEVLDDFFEEESDRDSVNDDGENDPDGDDDYVDPSALEARSVLNTANELSSQIVQTLQEWSDQSVAGLIVNGTLALGNLISESSTTSSSSSHEWISQETMKAACPGLTLADYQLIGVNWLALLHGMKCKVGKVETNVNGILADEMGLGKTAQTIAFMSWLKKHQEAIGDTDTVRRPHLVVAPASVMSNWEREFEKFASHLHVVKYHGSIDDRHDIQTELRKCLSGRSLETPDVILAPITYFQKEKSDDRTFLRRFEYEYMVVDEAHQLKNARGTRYKSLDKFKTNHRLLLTGTPVQNSPQELLSLLCFLMPLFSRKTDSFDDENSSNDGGEDMLRHFVSLEGGEAYDESTAYAKLKQLFAPFVLRRRKEDVLSQIMPPKIQKVEFVDLDPVSRRLYDSVISSHMQTKKRGSAQQQHLFTQLRKAAHHPLLLRSRHTSNEEKEHLVKWFYRFGAFRGEGCTEAKVAEETERYNDFMIHLTAHELIAENPRRRDELERYLLDEEDLFVSAKFVRLGEILPPLVSSGHRILIFSGWTSCLDLLTCLLEKLEIKYLRMEGSTPVEERQSLIDEFNQDATIPVFLLSTKACGLGINLTSADHCIFYDIDFNPMNDAQAEDRCHRIGQKKEVTVIRLVARDTVDQDIHQMQQRKIKMSRVIMETNGDATKLNKGKSDANEKNQVLQTALNRFLQSPATKSTVLESEQI